MDCRSLGLETLPIIPESDTYSLTQVLINDNKIKLLDEKILETWDLLLYIDLSGNPLDCEELVKLGKKVHIISDCLTRDKRKLVL